MNKFKMNIPFYLPALLFSLLMTVQSSAQVTATHTRGKLWESLANFGFIGDGGAWDYQQISAIGLYPGFTGYTYPDHEERVYLWPKVTANFHNFRSGPWIFAKKAQTLVPPDYHAEERDFLFYHASLANGETGTLYSNPPFKTRKNFIGADDFNPLLPEEMNYSWFHTATGITVKQRSMTFSYPDYDDFIIYDYIFTNTGELAFPALNDTKQLTQTLNDVYITFHSGIQVSTKGILNFHYDENLLAGVAPGGGFLGWRASDEGKGGFMNYYAVENQGADGKGVLYYSRNYNGGREPIPSSMDPYKIRNNWENFIRLKSDWLPELQDPACFGFVFLYRTPPRNAGPDPFDADPNFVNVYSDERDNFKNKEVDFENFGLDLFKVNEMFEFATHNFLPPNEGNLYCWYTSTFGPYTLAPGDSIRLILAEIGGVMDLKQVALGDPDNWYPDSSITAIRKNAEAARNAVRWGVGGYEAGIQVAADAPEPPPAPNCTAVTVSAGLDTPFIAVRWDATAENAVIKDGAGNVFYDGASDLDGYRIYRTFDERGIWWDPIVDIPISDLGKYWNAEESQYEYWDKNLQFDFEFKYYVEAYNSDPKSWTSINGSVVNQLGELVSDDYNQTPLVAARPGPADLANGWDVFVVPNPYVEGDPERSFGEPTPYKIVFRNLPEKATIKIFTVSGDLVKTLSHGPDEIGNLFGSISWDQRSEAGLHVAPGLYIYVVQSEVEQYKGQKTSGKLMIIR
ncbi:MAG: hypothetical protein EHM72_12430 [Calditrichaeota bacterium]|nr:MAG: hypothetical protein EHM72_12430 [Calditrichota bacterium]